MLIPDRAYRNKSDPTKDIHAIVGLPNKKKRIVRFLSLLPNLSTYSFLNYWDVIWAVGSSEAAKSSPCYGRILISVMSFMSLISSLMRKGNFSSKVACPNWSGLSGNVQRWPHHEFHIQFQSSEITYVNLKVSTIYHSY